MKTIHITLCTLILISGTSASAGPSAHRTQDGSGFLNQLFGSSNAATEQEVSTARPATTNTIRAGGKPVHSGAYDGIWKDPDGRMMLIKQIHRTLFVSGSSLHAAWQAQCVMTIESARCLGTGISNSAGEFRYESTLHRVRLQLQSDWIRHYNNGNTQSAHTRFSHAH